MTRTFPVSCYITGADYDIKADEFWEALHETGPGILYHPRWGDIRVLAVPESQTEEFVNGCGRAVFSVIFIKADSEQFKYPFSEIDSAAAVSASVDSVASEIGAAVPDEITDPGTLAQLADSLGEGLDNIQAAFDEITGLTDEVRESIKNKINEIENNIDDLVSAPADLMTSVLALYRLPGDIIVDISEKLTAYETIYSNLAEKFIEQTQDYGEMFGLVNSAMAVAIAVSMAESTQYDVKKINVSDSDPEGQTSDSVQAGNSDQVTEVTRTRESISEIITGLDDMAQTLRTDIESMESAGGFSVPVNLQIAAERTITSALTGLIASALDLPVERKLILDREENTLALAYELFGSIKYLDILINYNRLEGNDRILIPRGTEVRWFNVNA